MRSREKVSWRPTTRKARTAATPQWCSAPAAGAGSAPIPASCPVRGRRAGSAWRAASYAATEAYAYTRLACGGEKMS